ncbi:MAG: TolC family protein, partial [Pseudomonadota bacterium]|nr:TolC family protein [Pseudomonadota bacterium]
QVGCVTITGTEMAHARLAHWNPDRSDPLALEKFRAKSDRLLGSGAFGSGGLALAAPLFNAQALGFQQQAAEAQARQALAQYEQTVLVAFREVEDALVAVRTAHDLLAA